MKPNCAACCGLCCRYGKIRLLPEHDAQIIAENQWTETRGVLYVNRKPGSGACVYLDEGTNRCSIYARRPHVCRQWECTQPRQAQTLIVSALAGLEAMPAGFERSFVLWFGLQDSAFRSEYSRRRAVPLELLEPQPPEIPKHSS